jgi:uncharacterized membrane protein YoaK (UPF0700 family)
VSRKVEPQRVPLIALAAALAFGSGATDLASFTRLGGVFASVMTGNLVLLGLAIARASAGLAAHTAVAFAGYVAGVATGTTVGGRTKDRDELWPVGVTVCLAIELAFFAVFTAGWELADAHPAGAWQLCLLAVGALAMGLQGAAVQRVRTPLRTTYLTSTLIGVVEEIVKSGRRGEGFSLNVTVLVAAVAGAAAGGGVIAIAPACLPALPTGAVAAVVTLAAICGVR